ncbi:MAG: hypothetical protein B6I20_09025 [Bacteroidetes bacterium 4572_117]|nr:MAG: hypothetical protein B6I20_09025 [Bacteroidetes bacterium 4572_117]
MLKKYIIRLLVFSAIISTISYFLFQFALAQYYLPVFPYLISFFITVSVLVHYILLKASDFRIAKFSTFFMGSVSAKLFLYIFFLIIYLLIDKENAVPFLLTFLALYFLFTIFETISLLFDLKEKN